MSAPLSSTSVEFDTDTFTVKGSVSPESATVEINGSEVALDGASFSKDVSLDVGENAVNIVAKNDGNEVSISRTITRKEEPAPEPEPEPEPEPQPEPEPEPEPEPQNPTVGIGESVTVGDAQWKVTNARFAQELRSDFGERKRGNFVIVDFTFTNLANESVTLDTISMPMVDSEGREYEADTDDIGYVDPDKWIFLNQVNPGVTQQGQIIYSVAPGASGFTIHAGDLAFFGAEEANIKLGF